jgi:hypothetical protein
MLCKGMCLCRCVECVVCVRVDVVYSCGGCESMTSCGVLMHVFMCECACVCVLR